MGREGGRGQNFRVGFLLIVDELLSDVQVLCVLSHLFRSLILFITDASDVMVKHVIPMFNPMVTFITFITIVPILFFSSNASSLITTLNISFINIHFTIYFWVRYPYLDCVTIQTFIAARESSINPHYHRHLSLVRHPSPRRRVERRRRPQRALPLDAA